MGIDFFSYSLTKLNIYHLSLLIITQDALEIAHARSMQDACHHKPSNMTSLAMSLTVAQWLECPTGLRKVMDSTPVGDIIFFCSTLVTSWT